MTDSAEHGYRATLLRLLPWLLIGALVLFHAVNNWIWLVGNVTWTGWDKARHLTQSLNFSQMLSPPTIRSLFDLMIADSIRPPLVPASAAVMYWLFGRSADIATMINVVYMAIALAATYGLGRRWAGRRLGFVSVILLAFFPMFYAMSRHFYLEFALMAMVALTVYLLVATDGFQRRGISILFGLSLGLGLLTKRTFAVFLTGPLIVAILASGLFPLLWHRLKQRPRLDWSKALLALLGGLAVSVLWYWPNRETAQTLILGDALFFIWWGLAALTIYFLLQPPAPLSNALSAAFLAASLASTWYLARIEFVQRVALYGYGIDDPRGRALRLDSPDTYLYYVRKLANEHLSIIPFLVLLLVLVVAVVVTVRRQGSVKRALRQLKPEGWVVLAWVGGGYVLLTLSIYQETRAFTPVLPAVALIFGAALLKLPWRRIRLGLLALILVFGLWQFFVLSYESVYQWLPPRVVDVPPWGRTSLFAQGTYIQLPDEGRTDRRYWVQPDILQRMEQRRQALGSASASLGLLVNTMQINAGPFNYLILTEYPNLRIESLIDRFEERSPYTRLFAHDYVAVTQLNAAMNPSQEKVIEDILGGPPTLFEQAFELETSYLLPDGEEVYLYRKRHPLPADYPIEYITDLGQAMGNRTRMGDAILLTPPELVGPFVSSYPGPAEIYLVPDTEDELAELAARHRRLFLVLGDASAGEIQGWAQAWLDREGFRAAHEWAGSLQVLTYGTVEGLAAVTPTVWVGVVWDGQIRLVGYDLPRASWYPEDVVPVTLFWQRQAPIDEEYKVFVHLLGGAGQLVAQTDSEPVGGLRPTSEWQEGEIIVDRHGLLLPGDLPVGEYELLVGVYLPQTGERLQVYSADGRALGDRISLGTIVVASP